MLQPLVFGLNPQCKITSLKLLYLYPRRQVIVRVWPKRTWLITVSYVNMTPDPSPPCRRAPTSAELQVQAQVYSLPSFFTSAQKGDCHWLMTLERGNCSSGNGRGEQGWGVCVDGKFTSAAHCDKHREDSGCPGSNSKQLDYPPQGERMALDFC